MNGKIPVIGSVFAAYRFAFGEFLTVLRLSWLWMAVMAATYFIWGPSVMAAALEGFKSGSWEGVRAAMDPVQGESTLLQIVQIASVLITVVALLRVVISGDRRNGVPLHLVSGMPDLRAIGVIILLIIAALAAAIAASLVFATIAVGISALPGAGSMVSVLALAFFAAGVWVALRLALVLPVVSVESNFGVERSWSLMQGNSLRLLLASFLTFAPFLMVSSIVSSMVLGTGAAPELPKYDPADAAAFQAAFDKAMLAWGADITARIIANWPAYIAMSMLLNVVALALFAGLYGRAYRAVAGMDPE